jgi:hypothetical protein
MYCNINTVGRFGTVTAGDSKEGPVSTKKAKGLGVRAGGGGEGVHIIEKEFRASTTWSWRENSCFMDAFLEV